MSDEFEVDHEAIWLWVRDAFEKKRFNFAAASRATGRSVTYLRDFATKRSPKQLPLDALFNLAEWLEVNHVRPSIIPLYPSANKSVGIMSAGQTTEAVTVFVHDVKQVAPKEIRFEKQLRPFAFPVGFFSNASDLVALFIENGEMGATLPSGSYAIVDRSVTSIDHSGIYGLMLDGKPVFRRLTRALGSNDILVTAEDSRIPQSTLDPDAMQNVFVIGRVVYSITPID